MRHRRTLPALNIVLHEVFLGGRQAESDGHEATDYFFADQLWKITSNAVKCDGPRTGALEMRSVIHQGTS